MGEMSSTDNLHSQIDRAARALLAGGAVIYPTETFYGLGAAVEVPEGIALIASIKQRTAPKPLPVIAADVAAARALWRAFPRMAALLAERFWPGPLTIVLPASDRVPQAVAPGGEVGVRVSPHPVAVALARVAGPLVATSANLAGGAEKTRVEEIDPAIASRVDAIVDVGATPGGKPSTVLRLYGSGAQILREGALPRSALRDVIGEAIDG